MTQGDDATQGSGWNAHAYDRSFGFVSQHGKSALELLNPQPGERILDLGCGTGELTSQIADAGADVEGIDADENMVAVARQRRPDLVFRRADGHTFRVDEGFDAVFSNAALHWMLRPAAVVDRVWEALRPSGRFVAEMGGAGNVQSIVDGVSTARVELGFAPVQKMPWFFPTIGLYSGLLETRGFHVVSTAHIDRPTPLQDGADGVAGWVRMFGASLLADIPAGQRDEVAQLAGEVTRDSLVHGGVAYADYKRLRFAAIRPQ